MKNIGLKIMFVALLLESLFYVNCGRSEFQKNNMKIKRVLNLRYSFKENTKRFFSTNNAIRKIEYNKNYKRSFYYLKTLYISPIILGFGLSYLFLNNINNKNYSWEKIDGSFYKNYFSPSPFFEKYKNLDENAKITEISLLEYNDGNLTISLGNLHEISEEMAAKIEKEFCLGEHTYVKFLGIFDLSVQSYKDREILKKFIDYIDTNLLNDGKNLFDAQTKSSIKNSLDYQEKIL